MNHPKMTGKAGQAGISLLELVIAITFMAMIVGFLARLASNNQTVANDVTAKMAVSQVRLAASQCWNVYRDHGAQVSASGDSIECLENSAATRTIATLPEGVRVILNAPETSSSIELLGAYHERGSKSGSTSSTDRTTFCLEQDESISVKNNTTSCSNTLSIQ